MKKKIKFFQSTPNNENKINSVECFSMMVFLYTRAFPTDSDHSQQKRVSWSLFSSWGTREIPCRHPEKLQSWHLSSSCEHLPGSKRILRSVYYLFLSFQELGRKCFKNVILSFPKLVGKNVPNQESEDYFWTAGFI